MLNKLRIFAQKVSHQADVQPRAVLFVVACGLFAVGAQYMRSSEIVATGVTDGAERVVSTTFSATVSTVHAAVGEHVRAGTVVVSLSSGELLAERDELEAEVREFAKKADAKRLKLLHGLNAEQQNALLKLADARAKSQVALAEAEQHDVEAKTAEDYLAEAKGLAQSGLIETKAVRDIETAAASKAAGRKQASAAAQAAQKLVGSLERSLSDQGMPTDLVAALDEVHQAELSVLEVRLKRVRAEVEALNVRAPIDGVVAFVAPAGTMLSPDSMVLRVTPAYAAEVVAFLPPQTRPPSFEAASKFAVLLADGSECRGSAVLRSVGAVERKPEQLTGPLAFDSYGFPVRVTLPDHCRLPVGQIVELRADAP